MATRTATAALTDITRSRIFCASSNRSTQTNVFLLGHSLGAAVARSLAQNTTRVFAALRARKQLILVPSAGHNNVLHGNIWRQIESWLLGI